MTHSKSEIPALIVALGLTAAVVGAGVWWLRDSDLLRGDTPSPEATSQPEEDSSGNVPPQPDNKQAAPSAFSQVSGVPGGRFEYGGSTTWAPVRGAVDPLIQQIFPSFDLAYKDPSGQAAGSGSGIQMLIDGELDFAQSSRPLTDDEKQRAQQQGLSLQEVPVALEAVAIATHPDLSIPGVTLDQLKDIYTGSITNWNQVGGPNLPVVPASRGDVGGTVQYFQETVLDGQAFAANIRRLPNTTEALRFVGDTPGAIYFASAPEVVGQCTVAPIPIGTSAEQLIPPYREPYVPPQDCPTRRNQINLNALANKTYPLTRPLYVVFSDADKSSQAGNAYAQLLQTEEGQNLLDQVGFVPIR